MVLLKSGTQNDVVLISFFLQIPAARSQGSANAFCQLTIRCFGETAFKHAIMRSRFSKLYEITSIWCCSFNNSYKTASR